MKRYKGLTLRVLDKSAAAMGPGKAELVESIARTGSISAAAREMGMSYRRAWQLVEALNADFREPVVTTATGGARGGGARVTDFGLKAVRRFRMMESRASSAIAAELKSYAKLLTRGR
jgi:molybdate transport system regulatory protein